METTCSRCHQSVPVDSCYCPSCGLPQLVYSAEPGAIPPSSEHWPEAARDASSVDWKTGVRAILILAVPAGMLSCGISPVSGLGIFWMMTAAIWADVLYVRRQRAAWITTGAGARIGLVTGLIAAWIVFGLTGADLLVRRVFQNGGSQMDSEWNNAINKFYQQFEAQVTAPADVLQQIQAQHRWVLGPEARAGAQTFGLAIYCFILMLFAVAGGAIGARMAGRRRRPEI
jgi:hypothetical protein